MTQKGYLEKYKDSNVLFLNILDGDYYAIIHLRTKKIKLLKEFENEQIFIGSMSELNNVVVRLSAAPVRGCHSESSIMIRILIWHRFYAGCPS